MAGWFALLALTGCQGPADDAIDETRLQELEAELTERFAPGLHSLMGDVGMRHASLWFAGDARNWPLADYMTYELEELIGEIRELHPEYDGIQVAEMISEMTTPAIRELEGAIDTEDHGEFGVAFDRLTNACNGCHVAADRAAVHIQRPTTPPFTNLRYRPE